MLRTTSRRLFALGFGAILVVGLIGFGVFAYSSVSIEAVVDKPDSDSTGSLSVGYVKVDSEDADYVTFCATPNGRFAVMVELLNKGPLPVTIQGADPGPAGPVSPTHMTNGFSLDDLAAAVPSATGSDPRTSGVLPETSLAPGEELTAWARFIEGPDAGSSPGLIMSTDQIWIRVGVLGISKTVTVPLSQGVAMTGSCPGQPAAFGR